MNSAKFNVGESLLWTPPNPNEWVENVTVVHREYSIHSAVWLYEVMKQGGYGRAPNPTFFVQEDELTALKFTMPNTGVYTVNLPGNYVIDNSLIRDGMVTTAKLASAPAPHRCVFNKTYLGLTYKEDMCECGKGANRRGLYE